MHVLWKTKTTVESCYKKHGFPPGFKFKDPNYFANNVFAESSYVSKVQEVIDTTPVNFNQDQYVPMSFTQDQ